MEVFFNGSFVSTALMINITDDGGWENLEKFQISFALPKDVKALKAEPQIAIVTIEDNDGILI